MTPWRERLKRHELLVDTVRNARRYRELIALHRRQRRMRSEATGVIEQYLRSTSVRKLQLGAALNPFDGWLNTDFEPQVAGLIFLDVTRPFPLPSGCLDISFNEHLIEHVSHGSARFMLSECFRTLRPGGTVRIATPNLRRFIDLFSPDAPDGRRYLEWAIETNQLPRYGNAACFVLNNMLRDWGHQCVYDPPTLEAMLERAGFEDIRVCAVGESRHPELRNLESHGRIIGEENNLFETMVIEGRRPA